MKQDIRFDRLISRCRGAVETVAPQLICTNTEHLDTEGRFTMDFVNIRFSDNHLLTVSFHIDPTAMIDSESSPDWFVVNTVSHMDSDTKHNLAVVALQDAMEVEFKRKFNVQGTSRERGGRGTRFSTLVRLVD